ncbi:tetratricopeptide repeat protein [bacterium BMS3Abin03]|nr:tetratricopeptide repeat protein [bacterium BMS3Abin03]
MSNFCTQCGSEVSEDFKFCPNCGAEIIARQRNRNQEKEGNIDETEQSQDVLNVIVCDNCGEENPQTADTCISCGARLKSSGDFVQRKKTDVESNESKVNQPVKNSDKKKSKSVKKKSQPSVSVKKEKQIDSKKIILIASIIGIIAIVILLTSGALDSGVSVNSGNISDNIQNNDSGINLNNIQKINELEAKLKANPNDKETLLQLAHLQNDSGFYEKAIPLYQKYLNMVPSDADARVDMGVCYYNLRDYNSAIKEMKLALKYKPDHQIAHLNLGIVNLAAGNMDEAMKWLQKAVDLGPENEVGKRAEELLNSHKQ